ncbi:MAG: response regulator transcription factor [Burkholderiales bacterium]|nr:response regulator transcription factor [Burkholderiales bacterium]
MTAEPVRPTALIAEDEPLLREEIAEFLRKLWPELNIVAQTEDGVDALRLLAIHRPTVMFLDIQMPGLSGIEVAKQAAGRSHCAFVTAYDQYAIAAFDQGAVDYVLKPVSLPRLATTVQRLKERIGSVPADLSNLLTGLARQKTEAKTYLRWVNAWAGSTIKLITVDEICYFRADTKYTLVVTSGSESLIRKPIKELIDELDPIQFWQIHRSTIVNVNAIAGVTRDLRGHLQVKLKQRTEALPVSESYTHLFRQM